MIIKKTYRRTSSCSKYKFIYLTLDKDIIKLISKNKLKIVKKLLDIIGECINTRKFKHCLIKAVINSFELTKYILESKWCNKELLNKYNKHYHNCLMHACQNKDIEIVKYILESKWAKELVNYIIENGYHLENEYHNLQQFLKYNPELADYIYKYNYEEN